VPENRIIDLSYGAAKMLGITENGIHPVASNSSTRRPYRRTRVKVIVRSCSTDGLNLAA
jgi:rare lipoprotein A (peptidoglycan hydrolase)